MEKVWMTFTNQKQWEKYLKNLLWTNDRAAVKALTLIYNKQTVEEKQIKNTVSNNKEGFDAFDAPILTPLAKKALRNETLNEREIYTVKRRIGKYWKQLMIESKKTVSRINQERKEAEEKERQSQLNEGIQEEMKL
jgi:hypothetical protein